MQTPCLKFVLASGPTSPCTLCLDASRRLSTRQPSGRPPGRSIATRREAVKDNSDAHKTLAYHERAAFPQHLPKTRAIQTTPQGAARKLKVRVKVVENSLGRPLLVNKRSRVVITATLRC